MNEQADADENKNVDTDNDSKKEINNHLVVKVLVY